MISIKLIEKNGSDEKVSFVCKAGLAQRLRIRLNFPLVKGIPSTSVVKRSFSSLRQTLASQTTFLLVTSVIGYTFGYLYLIWMARVLGPESFGILGALLAIFYIACLVGQAMREAIATNVAEIKARAGELAAVANFLKLRLRLGLLFLLPTLVFVIASQSIAVFLRLKSIAPVIVLALSISTALTLDAVLGLLQGLQKFRDLGFTGYLTSQGLKLILGVAFILLGWDLVGAVGALLASTSIAIVVGLALVRKELSRTIHTSAQHNPRLAPVIIPTLILALFVSMPTGLDVMLVTHFVGGKEAGLYNAVATLGKVVIFLPMAVSFALLPKITEAHARGLRTKKILLQNLLFAFILSGGVALFCWIFSGMILRLFFGEAYADARALIGWYGLAMLLFSLDFVLVHYSLAIRNLWLILMADFVTLVEVVAITQIHQSLSSVIWILLLGNLLVLLVAFPLLAIYERH